ncbi:MAG TPA: SelB C-terminal domain-containing protein [Acidimicrobiales bacterium]|nr:SelB C-terminal domain-containing protein [Acidimicrobiales bacterium]
MHVIATAGHVDHGKSALVRALTGMEPDRWAEEIRRGMTIDLGYAWTTLPSGEELAFVDVPGHERFTTNMLAGVGPAPAALVVVAADGGWAPQTAEHVAALDALAVTHGVLAVTRSDLADPGPALADARRRLGGTSLGAVEAVAVSSLTGAGLAELRAALDRLVAALPEPRPDGRVRLWVDRAFTVKGFGTVLTGTLGSGRVASGDVLELDGERVSVRGVEVLGRPVPAASAVARVAVNLRAVPAGGAARGQALLAPGAWWRTDVLDGRIVGIPPDRLPRDVVAHVGSAAVAVAVRRLGPDLVRLELHRPLPLQVGDRLLLRDPGLRRLACGLTVVDPAPPALRGRGASRRRTAALAGAAGRPDAALEVERRGLVDVGLLARIGVEVGADPPPGAVRRGRWLVRADRWDAWRRELLDLVGADRPDRLVDSGLGREEAARRLALPEAGLLDALAVACPELVTAGGRVRRSSGAPAVRPELSDALVPFLARWQAAPFDAPDAGELSAAGLGSRQLGAAAAAGVVLRLPGDVILPPDAAERAASVLRSLPGPFTLSEARLALGTSRRVAVPLLEHLDRAGVTRRVDDVHRVCVLPRVAERLPGEEAQ